MAYVLQELFCSDMYRLAQFSMKPPITPFEGFKTPNFTGLHTPRGTPLLRTERYYPHMDGVHTVTDRTP